MGVSTKKKTGVVKNYIYNLSYQIMAIIVPLITTPYVSRVLLAEGVGTYSYTYTIAYAFSLIAGLGINTFGQIQIAYRQDNKYERSTVFFELCIVRTIATMIAGAIYIIFSFIYKKYIYYLLLQFFVILSVLFDISWYFRGVEKFKIVVFRNIIIKVISTVCIFVFVKTVNDVDRYVFINSASVLISNMSMILCLRGEIQVVKLRDIHPKRQVRGTLEFFVPVIATQIYSHLDRIMLGALTNNTAESGYYEQARKIAYMMTTIISSLNGVLLSKVSNLYIRGEKEKVIGYYKNSFKYIMIILLPMVLGLIAISKNFTGWFFGNGYSKVAILLALSAPLVLLMAIGNFVAVQFLSPMGMQNQMTKIYIIAALMNIVLNLLLIPQFLSIGALVASLVAELYSCLAQVRLLKRSEYNFPMMKGVWRYFVCAVIMAAVVLAIESILPIKGILKTIMEVGVGAAVYFILLLAVGGLKDFKLIKNK